MKNTSFPRVLLVIVFLFPFLFKIFSQDCSVEKAELKGTYTGDCKKGKAQGNGKAVGTDTYEGQFKAGLPDGEGTYTWKNGNVYTGHFSKGLRDGKGTIVFKIQNGNDSMVDGYWKKDVYKGKYEHPYSIYDKSAMVYQLEVQYNEGNDRQIAFEVSNTSGGDPKISNRGAGAKMAVNNIQLITGQYGRMATTDSHAKSTETILYMVTFPIRMKVYIGNEFFEAEFREPGSYTVEVHLNL